MYSSVFSKLPTYLSLINKAELNAKVTIYITEEARLWMNSVNDKIYEVKFLFDSDIYEYSSDIFKKINKINVVLAVKSFENLSDDHTANLLKELKTTFEEVIYIYKQSNVLGLMEAYLRLNNVDN